MKLNHYASEMDNTYSKDPLGIRYLLPPLYSKGCLRIQVEVLPEEAHERAKVPQTIFDSAWLERVGGCLVGSIVLGLGLRR